MLKNYHNYHVHTRYSLTAYLKMKRAGYLCQFGFSAALHSH